MNLFLIIQREYFSRIRRKSFILMTFLTPLLFSLIALIPTILIVNTEKQEKEILVFDKSDGYYTKSLQTGNDFIFTEATTDYFLQTDSSKSFFAVLILPKNLEKQPESAKIISENIIPENLKKYINNRLSLAATIQKLGRNKYPDIQKEIQESQVLISIQVKKDNSEKYTEEANTTASIIALTSSFLIYIFIFSYGAQVMRGVTEEKNGKILEVMLLTVRPFYLMTGKILGIAMVGITQFFLWILFLFGLVKTNLFSFPDLFPWEFVFPESISIFSFLFLFIIYFLSGYLLYASFFAIIGAISEPGTDTQQFLLPVTVPIIFAIYAGIYATYYPESDLSIWCSFIPFTSPIVMMARVSYGVNSIQIIISLLLLIGSFLFSTWIAGKIYKSAILLHGKKLSYRDLLFFICNK